MNPILRYFARNVERFQQRNRPGENVTWLFNKVRANGRRKYPLIPLSIRLVDVTPEDTGVELCGRGERMYVLRGWFVIRHYSTLGNHYTRYKEGDLIVRGRWEGVQITSTSTSRRQQAVFLGIIYGY